MLLNRQTANTILASADLNENWETIEDSFGAVGPYIVSGMVQSAGTGLSVNVTSGTALVNGLSTVSSFTIGSLAASNTSHLYWVEGTGGTSNTTGTQPADSVKLGTATTDGSGVTAVDLSPASGRQTKTYLNNNQRPITTKTSAYTITASDYTVLVDTTGGAVTITLPAAASVPGQEFNVKKIAGGNDVTVDGSGAETIDNAADATISTLYASLTLISDGSEFWII